MSAIISAIMDMISGLALPITPIMPALFMLAAAPFLLLLPGQLLRKIYLVALPVIGLALLWLAPEGLDGRIEAAGHVLAVARIDALSRVFATIFFIAAFLAMIFAWHLRDRLEQLAASLYAGAAIAACLAGDLISLFVFWEMTSLSSVGIILAARTKAANQAAFRYLMMQVISGLLLLAGVIIYLQQNETIMFNEIGLTNITGLLIFAAFGIKAAFPFVHNWLQDAYPEATISGTVFLSAFTTKLAIYALARGFPGTEILIYIGAAMTLFPIFYAVIENDLRRVLAYSLNNQLGFMVVGVGIGTKLAINGAVAHAFCHIIYKALLFMSIGAVILRTGTAKATQLGGLYKSMPLTMFFCVIGAASISAFPLFSGFISKSLTVDASLQSGYVAVWFILLFASAGVFHHSGIKIPFFAFFAHDAGWRVREAPPHMLIAMGLASVLCVGLGVAPELLYRLLPYQIEYSAYDLAHVISQLELLIFSALAFSVLLLSGIYPPEMRAINLDTDWFTRAVPRFIIHEYQERFTQMQRETLRLGRAARQSGADLLRGLFQPHGWFAADHPVGFMAAWISVLLAIAMLFVYN